MTELIGSVTVAGIVGAVVIAAIAMFLAFIWRVVVPTNLVHIVQSSRKTTSYGSVGERGNAYYNIPSFIPVFGVTRIVLPVNNFSIELKGYEAYDKDRAPFELDIIGFFVIRDTNEAAKRAASFSELELQLRSIMQGAARTILAKHDINEIMVDRATFGDAFTKEVDDGLKAWGVQTVKSLELMDIRDAKGSKIIHDIMAKKSSQIEMESRKVVADNQRQAEIAEIEASQNVEVRRQEQQQTVGQRTAEAQREIGIANEKASQQVQAEAKVTMDRKMDVARVQTVRQADIDKEAALVTADQNRQTTIIAAKATQESRVATATGDRDAALLAAEGTRAEGEAKGAAMTAEQMAPVTAQINLATKIGELKDYQAYLIEVRKVEAFERIGVANSDALQQADVKVNVTAGDANTGLSSLGEALSSRGGQKIGSMLESLAQTDMGKAVLSAVGVDPASKPNGKAAR